MKEKDPTGRAPRLRRRFWTLTASAASVAVIASVAALVSTGASATASSHAGIAGGPGSLLTGGHSVVGKTILWNWNDTDSNAFGVPMLKGAEVAANLAGVKLDVQFGNNDDTTQATEIKTAIAKGVAGYMISSNDTGIDNEICAAYKTGAPVVSMSADSTVGAAKICGGAFIGQSFVAAGADVANYMVQHGYVKPHTQVYCPVEEPQQVYAQERAAGADSVLKKIGDRCSVGPGTGSDVATAKSTLVQYLLGHHNTKAIIALGGTPMSVSVAAAKAAGLHIPIGGFDISFPDIITGIQNGSIKVTIGQNPFAQGFYSVMAVVLDLKYGITPSDINTSNGALITKANVGQFASLVPTYQ